MIHLIKSRLLAIILLCTTIGLAFFGCAKPAETRMGTGELVSSWQVVAYIPDTFTGDAQYEVMNSEWLKAAWVEFNDELFKKDLVKWDERYDCNRFAAAFVSFVQLKYYRENWGTWNEGKAPAVGEFWYIPSAAKPNNGHAVVSAITERGLMFFEPQRGVYLALTKAQKDSRYFSRF